MNNKNQYIDSLDELLLDTYNEYTVPEFTNSWIKIKTKVRIKQFLKLSLNQFNIYSTIIVPSIVIGVGAVYYNHNKSNIDIDNDVITKEILNNKIVIEEELQPKSSQPAIILADSMIKNTIEVKEVEEKNSQLIKSDKDTELVNNKVEIETKVESTVTKINKVNGKQEPSPNGSCVIADTTCNAVVLNSPLTETKKDTVADQYIDTLKHEKQVFAERDSNKTRVVIVPKQVVVTDTIVKVVKRRRRTKRKK